MNATTKLRIATYLRRLADRLNPPAQTITFNCSGNFMTPHGYVASTNSPTFRLPPSA